jgi:hypothetical protein
MWPKQKPLVIFCGKFSQLGDKKNCEKVVGFRNFSAISTKHNQKLTFVIILWHAKFEKKNPNGDKLRVIWFQILF